MQDIDKDIAAKYDLDIKSITPHKDAFILNTQRGKKLLRKNSLAGERILFTHGVKEHLYVKGFRNIDRYLCTTDRLPYIEVDGSNFTVSDFIEGVECSFDNRKDIINASILLANLHSASRGFLAPEGSKTRDELGKLPSYFGKRLDEIKKLRKVARKGRSKFDYMFLDYFNYFNTLGEQAIQMISLSKYDELVAATKSEGLLCHHDFTHHNIIYSSDKYYLINFDFCCFELKIYDLANLIRRKMRKCNWDIYEAKVIVDSYRTAEVITDDEMYVMKIMLQFPQKFWRVVNKYYNSKRSWSEKIYVTKLQEVVDEIEYHKKFMDKYELLM
ncbi:MAG: CotS family spore coat protein [Clostridia bacterium]|nr:CotS family spore coat protein [Clostridia bacterium]